MSIKDPLEIVVIKGLGSGVGSLLVALVLKENASNLAYVAIALLLGFFSYGLSIYFYIYAQRYLGAAKTSAYYAIAPFIGVGLSLMIFRELPTTTFLIALFIMILGMYLASTEERKFSLPLIHKHEHSHDDHHHSHSHFKYIFGSHSHLHIHKDLTTH